MTEQSITPHQLHPITSTAKTAHPLSSSRCGYYFALLSPLSVWLQLFILPVPTSRVQPLLCLGFTTLIPRTVNDLLTGSSLSREKAHWKGTESVKIHYGLTRLRSLSPSSPSFSESGKGGARTREGSKEEMTNWENYFAICGTCCVRVFHGGGKVAFP